MSFNTDDRSLGDFFGSCGEVTEAKVINDRETGRSRGFGFVTFADAAGPVEAKKRSGEDLDGRYVLWCKHLSTLTSSDGHSEIRIEARAL